MMPRVALTPGQVFRAGDIEPNDMYISRRQLESELAESLNSDQVSLLLGGSGSGKSWLYKKFFDLKNVFYSVLTVSRGYSATLPTLMEKELANLGVNKPTKTRQAIKIGEFVPFISAAHENTGQVRDKDSFLLLAKELRRVAKKQPAFVVIENAEQGLIGSSAQFLNDISNIVLSANSPEIARHNVRVLIVCADESLRTNLAKMPNSEPVFRRLRFVGEATSFTDQEARDFLRRGFIEKLQYTIGDWDELLLSCEEATDLRPDFMQEYCYHLAKTAEDSRGVVDHKAIGAAQERWAASKLEPYIERIAEFMNTRDTKKRVRDKILYVLALRRNGSFTTQNVLQAVKKEFPAAKFQTSEITTALNVLCEPSGESAPLMRRFGSDKNPLYGFTGAIERVATSFALGKRGDDIYRRH